MDLDYDKIVEDFDISGLTLRKITNKFVEENFKNVIEDILTVMTIGNGIVEDDLKLNLGEDEELEEVNKIQVPIQRLFMGQEMPISVWLKYIENLFENRKYVKTVNTPQGVFFLAYDKEPKNAVKVGDLPILTKKDIINGIKGSLKQRVRKEKG